MNTSYKDMELLKLPKSFWIESTENTGYPELREDIKVDAAIIGGGIAGITVAYLLKKEGLSVAVIEANSILHGTTGHTTAKITTQHGLIYHKLNKQHGAEIAHMYAKANQTAKEFIERIIRDENIDCDFFYQPAFCYTQSEDYIEDIAAEVKTAKALGLHASYTDTLPLPIDIKCAVHFDNQSAFHPLKYLLHISKDIPSDGSYIFENTRAVDIEEGETLTLITENGSKVHAKYMIIASHYPFLNIEGLYFSKLYPKKSYALGIKIKDKFPGGMYITAEEPGRSLRYHKNGNDELVIVGGEHHKTGQGGSTLKHYEALKNFAMDTFEVIDIPYGWSAQDYATPDSLPYAGQFTAKTPNIYVATGFDKWGMTNSTASAIIIKDLITKGDSSFKEAYNPLRSTPAASISTFIKENANTAAELISGKLKPQPEALVDTTCTHMHCELQWNDAEKTWDCPCHGSRFSHDGEVIEGPALKPLAKK